jgi:hypothetical protein
MPTFHCPGCGQALQLPDDVDTPVVLCPWCAELIAVRENPVALVMPPRPTHSEDVTAERAPDRQDVVAHQPTYRLAIDTAEYLAARRPPLPIFVSRVMAATILAVVVTVQFAAPHNVPQAALLVVWTWLMWVWASAWRERFVASSIWSAVLVVALVVPLIVYFLQMYYF